MSDLGLLKFNLQNIYISKPKGPHPDLVAFGTTIYHTSSWQGYIISLVYRIFGVFVGPGLRNEKLKAAIQKTALIFEQQQTKIAEHLKLYHKYLTRSFTAKSKNASEETCGISRTAITVWNHSTKPFLMRIEKKGLDSIFSIFRKNLGLKPDADLGFLSAKPAVKTETSEGDKAKTKVPFSTHLLADCRKFQRLIDFQSMFRDQSEFFLESIARLSCENKPYLENRKQMDKFVARVNENCKSNKLTVGFLHRVFTHLVDFMPDQEKSVARIERELSDLGCTLFAQEDPAHMKWRKKECKEGGVITLHREDGTQESITLGKQIGAKTDGTDRNVYFEDANDRTRVVWVSINPSIMRVRELGRAHYTLTQVGVMRVVEFREIDAKDRFAVMQRLEDSIENIAWTSGTTLSDADKKMCGEILRLLQLLLKKEQIPVVNIMSEDGVKQNQFAKYLRFDANGLLRCTKIPQRGDLDFIAIEDFIRTIANNNLAVFQYLVKESGLKAHDKTKHIVAFFQQIVTNALEGKKESVDDIAARKGSGITEPETVTKGKELFDSVVTLKRNCVAALKKQGHAGDEQVVAAQIKLLYLQNSASSFLWPTMEADVVNAIMAQG